MYDQEGIAELITSNPLKAGFMILILAPVLEEAMFRTLIKPSHFDLMLFFAIWPTVLINGFIPSETHWTINALFIIVLLFTLSYVLSLLIPEKYTLKIRAFLERFHISIWVVSSVIFGLVHISNYVDSFTFNLALFILTAPRIIAGFMMGWVKIKNGAIYWSMALHFMNNALPFLLALAAQGQR